MHLNNKYRITIIFLTVVFLLIIIFTICFFSYKAKLIKQCQEQIRIHCTVYNIADSDYLSTLSHQYINQTKFYQYTNLESENSILTPYSVSDYVPYKITVTIKNDSKIEFLGKHLVGIYSPECVFTENSSISYWTGSISPYTTQNYEMVIWFNKDFSTDQISQYISSLNCSYQLLGNFSYSKKTVTEKILDVACEFEKSE